MLFILIYIYPKCITFNNTLSPPLHIVTQVSPQPKKDINIDELMSQTNTLNHIMDSITIIKYQQIYKTKIIKELIKLNKTKPIQPSPSRSITSIKCPLNKHILPLLSLTISKPKLNFINILNQSHNITITNKYSKPITYTTSHTSKSAFPSPIILFAIKNNLLYNSKIKYVFNSTKNS